MGKPLVRFCEGPGFNEGQEVGATGHVVVACDEAFSESPVEHLNNDHLETSVYSKIMDSRRCGNEIHHHGFHGMPLRGSALRSL